MSEYKIPIFLISLIAAYTFGLQILIDTVSYKLTSKFGFRKTIIFSCLLNIIGLILLAIAPIIFTKGLSIYLGIMIAITFMSTGAGLTEIIFSPIIESLPLKNKQAKMSFLHSFYSIGHILIILLATLFFNVVGIKFWQYFVLALTIVPIITIILFANCPIIVPKGDEKSLPSKKGLLKNKTFLLLMLLIFAGGASEIAIAQWISYFAESGLGVDKSLGDLIGGCLFAFFMIVSRLYFGRENSRGNMILIILVCSLGLTVCFLLSALLRINILCLILLALGGFFVGIIWPGTYSISSKIFANGGTYMFAMLALSGDLGCVVGPSVIGFIAGLSSIKVGILAATIFPIIIIIITLILNRYTRRQDGQNI